MCLQQRIDPQSNLCYPPHVCLILKKKVCFLKVVVFSLGGVPHTYKNPSPVPVVHFPLDVVESRRCTMALRGKEELQLQHLLNNFWGTICYSLVIA